VRPDIITGDDFTAYSSSIKYALLSGMMAAGLRVKDVGLALSPMAYFGQFALDCPCVAMVTGSRNDNGWTGVKMGANRPMTFRARAFTLRDGGYEFVEGFRERYIADLTDRPKIKRKLKVVAACGNGTAGAFAPKVLEAIGCELIPLDAELDYTFPRAGRGEGGGQTQRTQE
jgi:phosphomannomutase/phosphoglucomutase